MSTFTDAHKTGQPPLDGPNDLKPKVKTSFILRQEGKPKAKKTTKKRQIVTPGEE